MKKKQEGGKIEGGQVFVFSKNIKNNGKIISSGSGAKTHIKTDKYSGVGSVESHARNSKKESWLKKHATQVVVGITVAVIGGLVLYYIFGIK